MVFTIGLDYMQSIKLLADNSPSVGCMTCLFNCLNVRFQSLEDEPPSLVQPISRVVSKNLELDVQTTKKTGHTTHR
jgi:Fe-S-cluster-containing dehydrogenase component